MNLEENGGGKAAPGGVAPPLTMKAIRKFKGSWFTLALVAAIIVGEVAAWEIANAYGFRAHPLVVAFLCIGLVTAITSVLYENVDIG